MTDLALKHNIWHYIFNISCIYGLTKPKHTFKIQFKPNPFTLLIYVLTTHWHTYIPVQMLPIVPGATDNENTRNFDMNIAKNAHPIKASVY